MSQFFISTTSTNLPPDVPTEFTADTGMAIPVNNNLNVVGGEGIDTLAMGDTITISGEDATAGASSGLANKGIASFDSSMFTVTAGFVQLAGGGTAVDTLTGNSGGAISPTASGNINTVGTGSITTVGSGNTLTTQLTGLTNHAVLIGSGNATITKSNLGTNGQVLIGSTGSDPAFATLTSSGGTVTFTAGANSLNLEVASGGFTWTTTSGTFTAVKENGYFISATSTANLPASPTTGDTIKFIVDHASQLLTIDAPGTQLIRFGNIVTSAGGTFVSTARGDTVSLVYQSTGTVWVAESWVGTWNFT